MSNLAKNNPVTGSLYFFKGLSLAMRPGVRRFVMVPLLINVVLFGGLIWLGVDAFDAAMAQLIPEGWELFRYLLWPLFALAVMLIGFYTFALLANFVAAPFNGMLAEAVERELTGRTIDGEGGLKSIAKDTAQAIASELRKLGYVLPRTIPLLLLFLVPGLGLLAPFLWFAFSAWMLAVSYVDFPMGNHGLGFPEQRARLRRRRWAALGFGGTVMVAITIPFVNFLAIPAAVAGATAMWVDQLRDE